MRTHHTITLCLLCLLLGLSTLACGNDDTAPPDQSTNNGATNNSNNGANNGDVNNGDANNGADMGDNNGANNGADVGDNNGAPEDMGGDDGDADMGGGADMGGPEDMGQPDVPQEDMGGEDLPTDPGGECDPFGQDCPEDDEGNAQQCIPVTGEPTCVRMRSQVAGEDEPCEGAPDCGPGMTCINWSDGRGQLCTVMCQRDTGAQCGPDKACTSWIQSNQAIGLCAPRPDSCDIYAQDCPQGEACTFGRDPDTNDPIFVCEGAGEQGDGELCSGGNGRCMAGFICIREEDDMSRCHRVCPDDDAVCENEQTCSGRSSTWQVTFCR